MTLLLRALAALLVAAAVSLAALWWARPRARWQPDPEKWAGRWYEPETGTWDPHLAACSDAWR